MSKNIFTKYVNRIKRWQENVLSQENDEVELYSSTGKRIIISKAEALSFKALYTNDPTDDLYKVRNTFCEKYKFVSEHGVMISAEKEDITFVSATHKAKDGRYQYKLKFSYQGKMDCYVYFDPAALVAMIHDGYITSEAKWILEKYGMIAFSNSKELADLFKRKRQYDRLKALGSVQLHHIQNYTPAKGLDNNVVSNTCFLTTHQHQLLTNLKADRNLSDDEVQEELEKLSAYAPNKITIFIPNGTKAGEIRECNSFSALINCIEGLSPKWKIERINGFIKLI